MKLLIVLSMLSLAGLASAQSAMGTSTSPSTAPSASGTGTIGTSQGTMNTDSPRTTPNQQRMEDADEQGARTRDTSNMNSVPATTPSAPTTLTP